MSFVNLLGSKPKAVYGAAAEVVGMAMAQMEETNNVRGIKHITVCVCVCMCVCAAGGVCVDAVCVCVCVCVWMLCVCVLKLQITCYVHVQYHQKKRKEEGMQQLASKNQSGR